MRRFVVGIDGSAESRRALAWALEAAREAGATLDVVHVWSWSVATYPGFGVPVTSETITEIGHAAEETAQAVVDEVVGPDPDVEVRLAVVEGAPAACLIEAADGADLLVVGSRGRGGFTGLLLGSVSQQCAHHARCPLVIVPSPHADQRARG